ncbi:Uncharacterized protein FWK35_00012703 [Aphis craccivora]|uniref:Uncharacterized protein n=1 Tax=Aphis craccivora TaxID=307492 RepID=A0A6G0YZZ2_APHCR|nr:Uncharacterized protein FWK35_00012703 [Aphis craccivora]
MFDYVFVHQDNISVVLLKYKCLEGEFWNKFILNKRCYDNFLSNTYIPVKSLLTKNIRYKKTTNLPDLCYLNAFYTLMTFQKINVNYDVDTERSDECIDLTMLCCVFFFLTCRNNASIFNPSSFSGLKVNRVGGLRRSFFEIPNSFQKHREKPKKKKNKEIGNFYAKPVFDKIDFFIWLPLKFFLKC